MTAITPFQRQITPAIERHSSTAAAAPSMAAEPTAPSEYDPMTFDPEDPSTYPPADLYPDFDPFDPATWPLDTPSSSPQPSQSPSGGEEQKASSAPAAAGKAHFGIQIMASSYLLPADAEEFKGWRCRHVKSGRNYKYYVGDYRTRDEAVKALPKVRNSFPEAFIIRLDQ